MLSPCRRASKGAAHPPLGHRAPVAKRDAEPTRDSTFRHGSCGTRLGNGFAIGSVKDRSAGRIGSRGVHGHAARNLDSQGDRRTSGRAEVGAPGRGAHRDDHGLAADPDRSSHRRRRDGAQLFGALHHQSHALSNPGTPRSGRHAERAPGRPGRALRSGAPVPAFRRLSGPVHDCRRRHRHGRLGRARQSRRRAALRSPGRPPRSRKRLQQQRSVAEGTGCGGRGGARATGPG